MSDATLATPTAAVKTIATLTGPGTYGNRDRLKTAGWTWVPAEKGWRYEWSRGLTEAEVWAKVRIWTDSRKGSLSLRVEHE